MPFKSQAQRRKFYAMADRGEISDAKVKEWERETPKGKKLPEHVKKSALRGASDALEYFGFKHAAEELRLKIPSRTFHGLDAAHKPVTSHSAKRADDMLSGETNEDEDADVLAEHLDQLDTPTSPGDQIAARDPLDRQTAWGAPSNLSAGDTANRLSDMGQPTTFGGI